MRIADCEYCESVIKINLMGAIECQPVFMFLGQWHCQQHGGVNVNPLPPDSYMQVWSGGSAGSAAQCDDLMLSERCRLLSH